MSNKATIAAIAVLALAVIAIAPVADVADADHPSLEISDEIEDTPAQSSGYNNLFYDCLIVLIIAAIAAGALHIRAHPRK